MEAKTKLDVIQGRLQEPLRAMNRLISETMGTGNELMNRVVTDYLRSKGKQIRPIMVLLSAQMHGGINEHVLLAAAALEMLHNASLIHDDVVDDTRERRGRDTINAAWGNHIAVLVGDFFVSKALEVGLRTGSVTVVRGLSELGVELSTGEVDQICNARSHRFLEEEYMEMIRKKTASLFTHCMLLGADTSGKMPADTAPMLRFAELLGAVYLQLIGLGRKDCVFTQKIGLQVAGHVLHDEILFEVDTDCLELFEHLFFLLVDRHFTFVVLFVDDDAQVNFVGHHFHFGLTGHFDIGLVDVILFLCEQRTGEQHGRHGYHQFFHNRSFLKFVTVYKIVSDR